MHSQAFIVGGWEKKESVLFDMGLLTTRKSDLFTFSICFFITRVKLNS